MTLIYLAEFEPAPISLEASTRIIGLFSSTDNVKAACQEDSNEHLCDARRLLWIGLGGHLSAHCSDGLYVVTPLELDERIKMV